MRLLRALSNVLDFKVWASDVRQAYLQSKDTLMPNVYIRNPVAEFELDPGECLRLLNSLYGLCES